jgi:hypothetical protein
MEISKLIRKSLLEAATDRGINWDDSFNLLKNGITYCDKNKLFDGKKIKTLSKVLSDKDTALYNKFPEVKKSGKDSVAYINSGDIVVVGQKNGDMNSLLAYNISGDSPRKITNGTFLDCDYFKGQSEVGQVMLSDMDLKKVKSWANQKGSAEFSLTEPENPLMYREVKLKDLKDSDNKPLLSFPGEGSLWYKVESGDYTIGNVPEELEDYMESQDFTKNKPKIGSAEANFGFYFKDIQKDLPSFSLSQDLRDSMIYYPIPGSEVMNPTKDQCRDVIKKLDMCRTVGFQGDAKVSRKFGSDCSTDLFKNKVMALRCQGRNFISGVLGNEDEFNRLLNDRTSPFGLGELKAKIGKASYSKVTENIQIKINKSLNEELKKFSFNNSNFNNKKKVDDISFLVESIFANVTKDLMTIKPNLSEDTNPLDFAKNLGGSLLANMGNKFSQSVKERAAKFVLKSISKYLGLGDIENSYFGLALVNVFANTDIKDFGRLLTDCKFSSPIITKSLLEAYLDKMASKEGFDSFVYSTIKNVVTETAAETAAFKFLQDKVAMIICPILSSISDMILKMIPGLKK